MQKFRSMRWLPLALLLSVISAFSYAQVVIRVGFAPPPMPVYEQPPCPEPGLLWTPGYWAYNPDNGYYWVPGTWVPAPQPGLLWTPHYWGWENGQYIFHEGYWGPHVGYYGGVNYGFGYGGIGFAGGEWRGGVFAYNTAVIHVGFSGGVTFNDPGRVHVGIIENPGHVGFSGGPGGIHHEPTPGEGIAGHEPHVGPTGVQTQHQGGAASNPGSWAKNNGGHPANPVVGRPLQGGNAGGGSNISGHPIPAPHAGGGTTPGTGGGAGTVGGGHGTVSPRPVHAGPVPAPTTPPTGGKVGTGVEHPVVMPHNGLPNAGTTTTPTTGGGTVGTGVGHPVVTPHNGLQGAGTTTTPTTGGGTVGTGVGHPVVTPHNGLPSAGTTTTPAKGGTVGTGVGHPVVTPHNGLPSAGTTTTPAKGGPGPVVRQPGVGSKLPPSSSTSGTNHLNPQPLPPGTGGEGINRGGQPLKVTKEPGAATPNLLQSHPSTSTSGTNRLNPQPLPPAAEGKGINRSGASTGTPKPIVTTPQTGRSNQPLDGGGKVSGTSVRSPGGASGAGATPNTGPKPMVTTPGRSNQPLDGGGKVSGRPARSGSTGGYSTPKPQTTGRPTTGKGTPQASHPAPAVHPTPPKPAVHPTPPPQAAHSAPPKSSGGGGGKPAPQPKKK
jgi:hypothetical protein